MSARQIMYRLDSLLSSRGFQEVGQGLILTTRRHLLQQLRRLFDRQFLQIDVLEKAIKGRIPFTDACKEAGRGRQDGHKGPFIQEGAKGPLPCVAETAKYLFQVFGQKEERSLPHKLPYQRACGVLNL